MEHRRIVLHAPTRAKLQRDAKRCKDADTRTRYRIVLLSDQRWSGKRIAREQFGREMKVFAQAYIVCRDTEQEARDFVRYYVHERGDWEGVRNLLDVLVPNSKSALGAGWEALAANLIAGYGAVPLVGTAEQVPSLRTVRFDGSFGA